MWGVGFSVWGVGQGFSLVPVAPRVRGNPSVGQPTRAHVSQPAPNRAPAPPATRPTLDPPTNICRQRPISAQIHSQP